MQKVKQQHQKAISDGGETSVSIRVQGGRRAQRTASRHNVIGNHEVLRRAAGAASSSSLMAPRESEVYEREADQTAEQMTRTPAQSVQRKPT